MQLYKIGDLWQVHTINLGAYEGNFNQIMSYCMSKLDIRAEELEVAVSEMMRNDHDAADFGIRNTFIYSFRRKDRK